MDFPIVVAVDPSCQSTAFKISDNQSVSKIRETKAVCEESLKRVQTAEWGHKYFPWDKKNSRKFTVYLFFCDNYIT